MNKLLCAVLVLAVCVPAWAQNAGEPARPASQEEAKSLIQVLQKADAPDADKARACYRLAAIGGPDSVPALAALLGDAKLSSHARLGLEANGNSAAGAALRQAMASVKGRLLAGVINSVGMRRDAQAVGELVKLLGDADAEVAGSAAFALGRIATAEAVKALREALVSAPAERKPAIADACLTCADVLTAAGQADQAAAMYELLLKQPLAPHVLAAATRGQMLAAGGAGLSLVIQHLKGEDKAMFRVALRAARELQGEAATRALAAELPKLSAERQVLLLAALGDRGDAAALPAVTEAANSQDAAVRLAALRVLAVIGDASAAPLLFAAAVSDDKEIALAGQAALISLSGKEMDAAVAAALGNADAKVRRVAAGLTANRGLASAVPVLLKLADDADRDVIEAAVRALDRLAGLNDLPAMVALLLADKPGRDRAGVESAIAGVCVRLGQDEAAADKLLAGLEQAKGEARGGLIRLLGQTGTGKALAAVRLAAREADAGVQETAIRTLCQWPTAEAGGDMLDLARTAAKDTHKILALRGYIRLIGLERTPADKKPAMVKQAAELARRDDEKRLVLGAASGVADASVLEVILPCLAVATLKEEAGMAAVSVAEKVIGANKDAAAKAMQAVLDAQCAHQQTSKRARQLLDQAKK